MRTNGIALNSWLTGWLGLMTSCYGVFSTSFWIAGICLGDCRIEGPAVLTLCFAIPVLPNSPHISMTWKDNFLSTLRGCYFCFSINQTLHVKYRYFNRVDSLDSVVPLYWFGLVW